LDGKRIGFSKEPELEMTVKSLSRDFAQRDNDYELSFMALMALMQRCPHFGVAMSSDIKPGLADFPSIH
jgi:hypothetical protein